jgi:beta-phosphoglucomutase
VKQVQYDFAMIFDADGVIVDSNPFHKIAMRKFCGKHGIYLTEENMKSQIFGRTNKDWITKVFGSHLTSEQIKEYENEKEALFRQIFLPHIQPIKGLIGFLEKLRQHNIVRTIASSAPPVNVDFFLNKTGARDFFDIIINGDEVESSKPHPEIYLKTIEIIKYPPEKCIVVEDSLSGVQSARSAGCKVIGLTTTHTAEELVNTDKVINDFDDLHLEDLQKLVS